MRWLTFAVMALVCITLQTTVTHAVSVAGVRPDWVLVLVVFFALHVRTLDVAIAGWVLGLLVDFQSAERFGLFSISYLLVALFVHATRENVFRTHPLSHMAMTLVAGILVQGIFWVYCLVFTGFGGSTAGSQFLDATIIVVYTACWAPLFHAGMLKLSPWLGLTIPRYTHAGLARG